MHARGVADINPLGVIAYRARGAPSCHFHLGYHAMLASPALRPHRERSCDEAAVRSLEF
jgi:hypothetical protein